MVANTHVQSRTHIHTRACTTGLMQLKSLDSEAKLRQKLPSYGLMGVGSVLCVVGVVVSVLRQFTSLLG